MSSDPSSAAMQQQQQQMMQNAEQQQQQPNSASFEWPTDSQSYQLLGKIGRGAFATVWKALATIPQQQQQTHQCECAVKVLNLDHMDSDLAEMRREVQAMRLSSHANILHCHTAFVHDIHLWLVTTLMRKGSALHCLQTARKHAECPVRQAMEPHILYILQQSLAGLQYIHEQQLQIHRDIKGGNILLNSDGSVQLADFGVSQWLTGGGSGGAGGAGGGGGAAAGGAPGRARTFVGTPCWMAPEVMEQDAAGYDTAADVWSLGITALELAKGFAPYAKYPPMKVLILTIQEDPPSLQTYETLDESVEDGGGGGKSSSSSSSHAITETYSKQFVSLVDQCLQKNPTRRPTCRDLLHNHKALSPMTTNASTTLQQRRQALVDQVCHYVPDVGSSSSSNKSGNQQQQQHDQPVKIVSSSASSSSAATLLEDSSQNQQRQKGTTWVFSDGSQILSSTALSTGDALSVDDAMDQLDAFGQETGGEHYYGGGSSSGTSSSTTQQAASAAASSASASPRHDQHHNMDHDDEMNDFMDDLEQTLPGEDYQPPKDHERTTKR